MSPRWESAAPPSPSKSSGARRSRKQDGGGPVLSRLHAAQSFEAADPATLSVHIGPPKDEALSASELRLLRRRYHGRKFLFPLLDQGPNNQFLQFRVALQKAHALNRTLVLPIWLPHNPKFQHFHPGAPSTPSRDKKLDQMWYPFDVAFESPSLTRFVRTISIATFRQLTGGKIDRCIAHKNGFDSYLRLARISCGNWVEPPEVGWSTDAKWLGAKLSTAKDVRFLGFHQYDHDLGTRDRYYEYVRWARHVSDLAEELTVDLFNGSSFLAAHLRLADAHWERNDCKHTINALPVFSVSCGDPERRINHTSIAQEIFHAIRLMNHDHPDQPELRNVYLASNMNCSDARVVEMTAMLREQHVRLVCAQPRLLTLAGGDHFVASLMEQEICSRAQSFVGSKYSTWTDTILGMRSHAGRTDSTSFEDLWSQGIRI